MIKLLTILLLIPSMMFAQVTCWPSEATLGNIYNKSSFTNTSDFTLKGGTTMSLNGSAINISGGAGTFDRYATLLTPHSFSNYAVTMDVKMINATNNTSYGIGLGLRSINDSFPQDIFGWVNLSTVSTPGQILLYNSSGTLISSSPGTISWSTNDVIRQTFALADTIITYTVQNITTGGTAVSLSVTYLNSLPPPLTRPNSSNFAIYEIGGTFQLKALSINISDRSNTNIAVASDSKFAYYADSWAYAWPELLNAAYPTVTRFSGSGDKAAHGLRELTNLSLLNPRYLIWEFGSNDLRSGASLSTVEGYSDSVYKYFTPKGTTVYFILIPEDSTAFGIGQKSFDLWYRSHYPSNYISAVWDSLSTNNIIKPGYLSPDHNVHPSAAGHAKIAQALEVSGKFNVQGVCAGSLNCESPTAQAYTSSIQSGNQANRGELGLEFIVNNPNGIIIKQLGAFDDGANGITGLQPGGGVRVAIFNRTTHNIIPGLDVTISGLADAYTGNHRMKNISPVTLPPGDYLIVAKGYSSTERYGNVVIGGGPYPAGNDGGGAITFGNQNSLGPDDPNGFSYPAIAGNTGTTHQFLAGTFVFTTAISCGPLNNANLTNLVLSQGTLSPLFASVITGYSSSVPNTIASITITPTAAVAGATIKVNNITVASGSPSLPISLAVSSNIISIVVTAQDGTTMKTYTLNITRAAAACESVPAQAYTSNTQTGNQAHRGELGLEFIVNNPGGIIVKQLGAFDDGGNGITGLQPGGGVRVAIFNRTTHAMIPGLDVTVIGNADHYTGNHRMKDITPVTLQPGDYVIVAKGYHAGERNGNSFEGGGTYPAGDDGGAITFENETSYGPDDPNGFNYPAAAGNFGNSHVFLAGTFVFTKVIQCGALSTNANLSNLVLSQGTMAPPFAPVTTGYSASVPASTTSITVTPTVADAVATIKVNNTTVASGSPSGAIALSTGSNIINIVVTAQDGTTIKTYTVNVTRAAAGCESAPTQVYTSNTTTGNQAHRGELGLEFIVNNPGGITVKQLGAFDDGGNGITGLQPGGGVRVAIFNRTTHNIVPGLDVTVIGSADHFTGNHRMKDITPITLPQGDYVIVAKGYHTGERNGNSFEGGGPFPAGNSGGGAISFGNETSYGPDDPNGFHYPNSAVNLGDSHVFLAGTFNFTIIVNCPAQATADPETTTINPIITTPHSIKPQIIGSKPVLVLKTSDLKIYPDPTNGQFTIQLHDIGDSKLIIQIINLNGKAVAQKTILLTRKTDSFVIPFDLINQPPGIYLVKVESTDGIQTAKLIIQ